MYFLEFGDSWTFGFLYTSIYDTWGAREHLYENILQPPLRTPLHEYRYEHPPAERQSLWRAPARLRLLRSPFNAWPLRLDDAFAKILVKVVVKVSTNNDIYIYVYIYIYLYIDQKIYRS